MKPSIALMTLLAVSASAYAADTSIHRYVVESATPPSTQGKARTNDASLAGEQCLDRPKRRAHFAAQSVTFDCCHVRPGNAGSDQ